MVSIATARLCVLTTSFRTDLHNGHLPVNPCLHFCQEQVSERGDKGSVRPVILCRTVTPRCVSTWSPWSAIMLPQRESRRKLNKQRSTCRDFCQDRAGTSFFESQYRRHANEWHNLHFTPLHIFDSLAAKLRAVDPLTYSAIHLALHSVINVFIDCFSLHRTGRTNWLESCNNSAAKVPLTSPTCQPPTACLPPPAPPQTAPWALSQSCSSQPLSAHHCL